MFRNRHREKRLKAGIVGGAGCILALLSLDAVAAPTILDPGIQIFAAGRTYQAPELSRIASYAFGVRFCPFNFKLSEYSYIGIGATGLGFGSVDSAPIVSFAPITLMSGNGVGVGLDFYTVGESRQSGPMGVSLLVDLVRLFRGMHERNAPSAAVSPSVKPGP